MYSKPHEYLPRGLIQGVASHLHPWHINNAYCTPSEYEQPYHKHNKLYHADMPKKIFFTRRICEPHQNQSRWQVYIYLFGTSVEQNIYILSLQGMSNQRSIPDIKNNAYYIICSAVVSLIHWDPSWSISVHTLKVFLVCRQSSLQSCWVA